MHTYEGIGMRVSGRRENAVLSVLLLAVVWLSTSASCAAAQIKGKTADAWGVLRSYSLSSVAWSPNGDRIIFVAANDPDRSDQDDGLLQASVWEMSLPKRGETSKLRRLAVLTRSQGIPAALFWLGDNGVGWAASHYSEREHTFSFVQMGLQDSKMKPVVSEVFNGIQNRMGMESAFGGPDDVCYDAASRTLIFSGGAMPTGTYVKILSLYTGKVRKLYVPGTDDTGWVTLCGAVQDPQKPEFCIAAVTQGVGDEIWLSSSYSLHRDKVLVTSAERYLQFPRMSPDSKMLVYLSIAGETGRSEVMLYDLGSGTHRTLATLSSQWEAGIYPAMGCPFSWSPDGKMIAYADGARIKTVQVSENPGKAK